MILGLGGVGGVSVILYWMGLVRGGCGGLGMFLDLFDGFVWSGGG